MRAHLPLLYLHQPAIGPQNLPALVTGDTVVWRAGNQGIGVIVAQLPRKTGAPQRHQIDAPCQQWRGQQHQEHGEPERQA